MDWFVDLFKEYGSTAISIVIGAVVVIIFIAMMDRHNTGSSSAKKTGRKDGSNDEH
ncbi:MAG: hypothetical protein WD768_11285 [Phycisphaeraceae bacterium]